jgi:hypothetical protein
MKLLMYITDQICEKTAQKKRTHQNQCIKILAFSYTSLTLNKTIFFIRSGDSPQKYLSLVLCKIYMYI